MEAPLEFRLNSSVDQQCYSSAESVILSFKTGRESRAEVVKECVVVWVSVKNSERGAHNLLKQ